MKGALLVLAFAAVCAAAHAQVINPPPGSGGPTDTTEWRGWTGVSIGFKPVKAVALELNQQWRWNSDFTEFDRQLQQLEFKWSPRWNDLSKAQSLGFGIRHTVRPDRKGDVQGVDRFVRWQVQHGTSFDAGRWEFETRIRYQKQTAVALKDASDPAAVPAKAAWRFKGEIGYNIKGFKWDPAVSIERFVSEVPDGWEPDGSWRVRLATGTKTGKRQKLKVFIQRDIESRYNPAPPGMTLFEVDAGLDDLRLSGAVEWTVGLRWSYRIKLKDK